MKRPQAPRKWTQAEILRLRQSASLEGAETAAIVETFKALVEPRPSDEDSQSGQPS